MHELFRSVALVGLLAAAAGAQKTSQAPVELRWHGKVGDVLRHRIVMTQSMENSMMPQGLESETSFVFRQEVKEVSPEGLGSLDVGYEAVRLDIRGPMSMSYDSTRKGEAAKQNNADLAAMLEPMLAVGFQMKVEPSGHIAEITGLEGTLDKAFDQLRTPGLGEMFKQLFSQDSLRRMIEVNTFPARPLSAGDTWTRAMEVQAPMLGTLKLAIENELQGVEKRGDRECAKIAISGAAEFEGGAEDSPVQVEASMDDSNISGTMFFALDSGYLIESSMRTSMDLLMSFGQDGGMQVKMSMVTQQRTVRIGEEDPLFE